MDLLWFLRNGRILPLQLKTIDDLVNLAKISKVDTIICSLDREMDGSSTWSIGVVGTFTYLGVFEGVTEDGRKFVLKEKYFEQVGSTEGLSDAHTREKAALQGIYTVYIRGEVLRRWLSSTTITLANDAKEPFTPKVIAKLLADAKKFNVQPWTPS